MYTMEADNATQWILTDSGRLGGNVQWLQKATGWPASWPGAGNPVYLSLGHKFLAGTATKTYGGGPVECAPHHLREARDDKRGAVPRKAPLADGGVAVSTESTCNLKRLFKFNLTLKIPHIFSVPPSEGNKTDLDHKHKKVFGGVHKFTNQWVATTQRWEFNNTKSAIEKLQSAKPDHL